MFHSSPTVMGQLIRSVTWLNSMNWLGQCVQSDSQDTDQCYGRTHSSALSLPFPKEPLQVTISKYRPTQ